VFVINVEPNMGAINGMFLRDTPKERPLTHDLIQSIFKGFKQHFTALFCCYEFGSAHRAWNEFVFSYCVEFKVLLALRALEQHRYCFHYVSSL
jgi:hypothetical protein